MNVLIIGSGGREHAIGWKLCQSSDCEKLYFAPGNGGTAELGENVPLVIEPVNTKHVDAIDYFCRHKRIGLIVVGPENPLAQGLVDRLSKLGRSVFGPNAKAARIEADKAFAKQLMRTSSIPTAEARIFKHADAALSYVRSRETPVVVKAAGLAKGEGGIVCRNNEQAEEAVRLMMTERAFGEAGGTVVVEERLVGQEVSVLALVDGRNIFVLDPAQDHKTIGERDTGLNTGGMGAYSPTPLTDDAMITKIEREILVPVVDALRRDGIDYKGVLYAGLMLTAGGPKVIEFNCRFGDPEIQALLTRLRGDLLEIMLATISGKLDRVDLSWDPQCSCCVVMASAGYPCPFEKGKPIHGIQDAEALDDVTVFHAGTTWRDGQLVTDGGRVLTVCATAPDLARAQQKANEACSKIHFDGAYFRKDIGFRVLPRRGRRVEELKAQTAKAATSHKVKIEAS